MLGPLVAATAHDHRLLQGAEGSSAHSCPPLPLLRPCHRSVTPSLPSPSSF